MNTLGNLIRTRREELGWSHWKLGKETELGITHIKGIEAGKGCRFSIAMKLLNALGVETITVKEFDVSR